MLPILALQAAKQTWEGELSWFLSFSFPVFETWWLGTANSPCCTRCTWPHPDSLSSLYTWGTAYTNGLYEFSLKLFTVGAYALTGLCRWEPGKGVEGAVAGVTWLDWKKNNIKFARPLALHSDPIFLWLPPHMWRTGSGTSALFSK